MGGVLFSLFGLCTGEECVEAEGLDSRGLSVLSLFSDFSLFRSGSSRRGRGNFSLVSKVLVRYIAEDSLLRTLSSESSSFNKFESHFMINMTYTHLLSVLFTRVEICAKQISSVQEIF